MLNQVTKLRLPNGTEVALVDWSDRPLYSSADFQSGFVDEETDLFNYVTGDPVPARAPSATIVRRTATLQDTNISTPSAMNSTEELLIYGIKVELFAYTLDTNGDFEGINTFGTTISYPNVPAPMLKELQRTLMLQLVISQKVYSEATLGYYNTGFGPYGIATGPANLGAATVANQGLPSQEAVRSFAIPHHIGGQEKYRVAILNPTATADDFGLIDAGSLDTLAATTIRVYLDGLYKRPVS